MLCKNLILTMYVFCINHDYYSVCNCLIQVVYYTVLENVRTRGESMASKRALVGARVDPELKRDAEETLKKMGLTMSSGITLFLAQVVNDQCLPFKPAVGCQRGEETNEKK